MREILFRGKRPNGCWVQGDLTKFCIDEVMTTKISGHELRATLEGLRVYTYTNEVIPETVGQYTGLIDKNGKPIFEGDIVKYTPLSNRDVIYEVIWQQAYSRFSFVTMPPEKYRLYEFAEFDKAKYDCEIIGNIHDNPELTKGE